MVIIMRMNRIWNLSLSALLLAGVLLGTGCESDEIATEHAWRVGYGSAEFLPDD